MFVTLTTVYNIHSDSLHAWAASLQHNWASTCTASLSEAAIDSQSRQAYVTRHQTQKKPRFPLLLEPITMLVLGSHSPRETAADGAAGLAEGSRVGCYHRADIRAALAVVSQGGESCAPGTPRMLCPRIGVAHGHVSCGLVSRSDSSLEDGREPQGVDKTEQLIMSRTGSSQEGFGMMFACALLS